MSSRSLVASFSESFSFRNKKKAAPHQDSTEAKSIDVAGAWGRLATRLVKHNSWSQIGKLGSTLTLTSLPDDVSKLFDDLEREHGTVIDTESRLSYYKDFCRAALGSAILHIKRVEELLVKKMPEIYDIIVPTELQGLMRAKLEQGASDTSSDPKEFFDFDQFVSLLFDVIKIQREHERAQIKDKWVFRGFKENFPIEPENTPKQLWDILCMIMLLYCSFSVPLSIAFPGESDSGSISSPQDYVELIFDIIFMIDIVLTFLTAFDNQVPTRPN
jgi:hypothetical protein